MERQRAVKINTVTPRVEHANQLKHLTIDKQAPETVNMWRVAIEEIAIASHAHAIDKGFAKPNATLFPSDRRDMGTLIALIHTEISEAFESFRTDNHKMSEKVPEVTHFEEEMADAIIRIADCCFEHGYPDLGKALVGKMAYNRTRPAKHGKSF